MSFELSETTAVVVTNANPRRELHGEEKVRAIDIACSLTTENNILNQLQDGLREHHFCNKAADAQQGTLPDVMIPLPNLRFPQLPTTYHFNKGVKLRGYTFIRDFGTDDERVRFEDAVLSAISYEIFEGGSVKLNFTIQYNGDELQDNELYGDLSGLASEGEIHIRLLKPAELKVAKKGYRAGKPDTQTAPEKNKDQLELGEGQSPEDALMLAALGKVWSRGCEDEQHESIDALLIATNEENPLEIGEELDIDSEHGTFLVIRITAIDEETGKASFDIVKQEAPETEEAAV